MNLRHTLIASLLICAAAVSSLAQPAPAFEAISIKQVDSSIPGILVRGWSCHAFDGSTGHPMLVAATALGRCRVLGINLKSLISSFFGMGSDRIIGAPSWTESLPYTIEAKAENPDTTTRAQLQQMLQSMVLDRFKLKFHKETREVTGYVLVVGKNGSRLKDATPEATAEMNRTRTNTPPGQLSLSGAITTSALASGISNRLGVPVSDNTGLTGRYIVNLKWSSEDLGSSGVSTPGEPSSAPSLFTAIQEQLGLRLEPKKATIEVMVIDSVEKATEN